MASEVPFLYDGTPHYAKICDDGTIIIATDTGWQPFEGDIITRGVQPDDAITVGLALIQAGTIAKLKGTAEEAGS